MDANRLVKRINEIGTGGKKREKPRKTWID